MGVRGVGVRGVGECGDGRRVRCPGRLTQFGRQWPAPGER